MSFLIQVESISKMIDNYLSQLSQSSGNDVKNLLVWKWNTNNHLSLVKEHKTKKMMKSNGQQQSLHQQNYFLLAT